MKITIAQLNPIVGDIEGNLKKIKRALKISQKQKSDLIIFSELFLTGYPPRDLLDQNWFIKKIIQGLNKLKAISSKYKNTGILIGSPYIKSKKELFNSCFLFFNGKNIFRQDKSLLPNYDVFDEQRYFSSNFKKNTVKFKNKKLAITICEDIWNIKNNDIDIKKYSFDPIGFLMKQNPDIFINISSSPFFIDKQLLRYKILKSHCLKTKKPFIFINQAGGQDDLIFDGNSMILSSNGNLIYKAKAFKEEIFSFDLKMLEKKNLNLNITANKEKDILDALCLGLKDYIRKNNFTKVTLGLSGGIDSALCAYIAAKAIGNKNVIACLMPGPYSSKSSVTDAVQLCENLKIKYFKININKIYNSYIKTLKEPFQNKKNDITEENIQARIRGNLLMALSNKFNYLVLSTGNKSELAVGYCTLYGDMSGGLSVISDIYKTQVYKIANYINRNKEIIPKNILIKPPSAELRPGQKDSDSLPDYEILDKILYLYLEKNQAIEQICEQKIDKKIIKWVINTVNKNEYKRIQSTIGLKVSQKSFGSGRRMPIAAKFDF